MRKNCRSWVLILICFLTAPDSYGDRVSRAIKALQKGKHEQVKALIAKSLGKHQVNAGAHYVLALLHYDSTYLGYHLDSSHYYIELALQQELLSDSVESWPLDKASLTRSALLQQKHTIDSTAFQQALTDNTISSLQHFVDLYPSAIQHGQAIAYRDLLAFKRATETHTYQAYKFFIDTYPQASQLEEAQSRFHLLLFQSMTSGGKLADYIKFLEENPYSPYRPRAEQQVFELQTLDHQPESYIKFLQDYPESPQATKAQGVLYHLTADTSHNALWSSDSLRVLQAQDKTPWSLIYLDKKYGFMNSLGQIQLDITYDSLPDKLFCEQLNTNFFSFYEDARWKLAARNQAIIWDQYFDSYEDLGNGYLQLSIGGKLGIIHKGGWEVLPIKYDDLRILNGGFIAFKQGNYWGVTSMTGRELIAPSLSEVSTEGAFLLLKKTQWSIMNGTQLIAWYHGQQEPLLFQYDDWELISPGHLLAVQGEKELLYNENLQVVVPLSKHRIYEVDSLSWCSKTSHGTVRFYGQNLHGIPPDRYENFLANNEYIGLQRSSKWELWNRLNQQPVNDTKYDSVSKLGTQLLLLKESDLTSVLFPNGKTLALGPRQKIRFIRGADQTTGFLQVTTRGGLREVYNLDGAKIYSTWYYDVQPLTHNLLLIEKNGQKGVIDIKGTVLLKPRYETIVADRPGQLTLLQRGRFGYFQVHRKKLIRPLYQTRLSNLSEELLITSKNGKMGLVDLNNRTKVPFEFDEIKPWSDSTVLVLKERNYALYNFIDKSYVLEQIEQWQWVRQQGTKLAIFRIKGAYGLIDEVKGTVLEPRYGDIINLGNAQNPMFVTERLLADQEHHEISYFNQHFVLVKKQVLSEEEFDRIWCL